MWTCCLGDVFKERRRLDVLADALFYKCTLTQVCCHTVRRDDTKWFRSTLYQIIKYVHFVVIQQTKLILNKYNVAYLSSWCILLHI